MDDRIPAFTPCPAGFVTARQLDDGRYLIEGWLLIPTPMDGGQPRHEAAYYWITDTEQEATGIVAEFTAGLTT